MKILKNILLVVFGIFLESENIKWSFWLMNMPNSFAVFAGLLLLTTGTWVIWCGVEKTYKKINK